MATDQEIRDAGFKYVPRQEFLLNPFELPADDSVTDQGIVATNAFTGGGNNFNVYNPSNNSAFLGNYGDIDFNKRYEYNPQEFMTDANDFGYGVADEDKGFLSSIKNKLGKGLNFGKMIGGGILSAAGIPFLGAGLDAVSKNFEKRELGAGIIDEQGNFFDEDELNQQNALGGYYSNAARSARRRTKRIEKMLARKKAKKNFSQKNLDALLEQEKAQEAARQAAANQIQQQNKDTGTGGYQAGYSSNFMDGPSGGTISGQNEGLGGQQGDPGGTATMGSFKDGGRAGYFYGGRVNYKAGGRIKFNMGGAQFTAANKGEDISPGTDSGGNFRDGNNDNNQVINDPVDISTVTKSLGKYDIPYGVEALIADKGRLQAVLNADDVLNKNLGLDFTYDQGPYQVGFSADMEGNKNLGVSYNKGNLSAYANTDFNEPSLGFKYSKKFANGGLASIL